MQAGYCHPGRTCSNKCTGIDSNEEGIVDENITVRHLWVTIENTMLLLKDRSILLNGEWLMDNIIFAAEQLLLRQHPHISGLQDPSLQLTHTFDVHGSNEFVQILNLGRSHWITVSSIGCNTGTVKVYDSLNLMLTSAVKKVIADLVHTTSKTFKIQHNYDHAVSDWGSGLWPLRHCCGMFHLQWTGTLWCTI